MTDHRRRTFKLQWHDSTNNKVVDKNDILPNANFEWLHIISANELFVYEKSSTHIFPRFLLIRIYYFIYFSIASLRVEFFELVIYKREQIMRKRTEEALLQHRARPVVFIRKFNDRILQAVLNWTILLYEASRWIITARRV